MTNDEVRRAMTRISDARNALRAQVAGAAAGDTAPAPRIGGELLIGDRVLDVRGGREGTVSSVGAPSSSGAVLVNVRLDDGSLLVRTPFDLMRRPTPPGGRS